MLKEAERNPRKALGKGLSALLPSRPTVGAAAQAQQAPEPLQEFQSIPLDQILPGEEQPRNSFDNQKLMELAQSIRVHGVLQPIAVYREKPGKYRIIAGERRWKAAGLAGLNTIPALVRTIEQHQRLEVGLIENLQREDLNPIEIAAAFQRLADEHGLSHEQIAERTGKDRSTITNLLRLLRLSPFVQEQLIAGTLSVGHARTLLNLPDEQAQINLSRQIMNRQLSVRETEKLVKSLTAPPKEKAEPPKLDPNVRAALDEMALALGTRVKLVPKSDTAGKLEIDYYSQDDLDRIYSVIVR